MNRILNNAVKDSLWVETKTFYVSLNANKMLLPAPLQKSKEEPLHLILQQLQQILTTFKIIYFI